MRFPVLLAILGLAPALAAQELEPRSYSASPVGASFFVFGWISSSGAVVFDPTIPITDVHATVEAVAPAYGHTFAIGNVQALFTASLPYAWAWVNGKLSNATTDSARTFLGVGDLNVKLSVNFIGSPALAPAEFAKRAPAPWIVGASVAVVAPTGQYIPYRLINIGANRWAFKPQVGVSHNWDGKLYLDLYAGAWLFSPNQAVYPGTNTKTQDPLVSLQLHGSYSFTKRIYAALESTWYSGGETQLNGGPSSTRQDNTRVGALFSYGFSARESVKLNYSVGASARVGQKFSTLGLTYQLLWF